MMAMSSSPFEFSPPGLTPTRKRVADDSPVSPSSPHSTKKRRPNLANGFSGLSLSPRLERLSPSPIPSYEESEATKNEVDEDDLFQSRAKAESLVGSEGIGHERDVHVEELPDRTNGWTRSSITSSSTSSADDPESDSTFRPLQRQKRRYARVAQQADEVEQPDEAGPSSNLRDVQVEDLPQLLGRKREGYDSEQLSRRKRRRTLQDGDMDMDSGDEVEEIRPTARRRRKTRWHEPEKDRIVITSLGSSDSEGSTARSPSPDSKRLLSQPGAKGFTISPSLLTHLLSAREPVLRQPMEKGLVLYRPPARFGQFPQDQIVNEWNGQPQVAEDPSRFEEIDDEDYGQEPQSMEIRDISMDVEQEPPLSCGMPGDEDVAMDVE